MGTTAVGRGAAHLDGVRIPADHLLGEEGRGFTQVMQGFDFSRALIGLQCIGCAQQTVDETWEYVGTRQAFDQPLSKNQGVSFPLAEAETLLDRGPAALLPDALAQGRRPAAHGRGGDVQVVGARRPPTTSSTSACCCTASTATAPSCPIEQRLRDVLGLQIGDGTAQIMKLVIARQRLGRELAP